MDDCAVAYGVSERHLQKVKPKEAPPLTGLSPEEIGSSARVIRIEYVDLDALLARQMAQNAKKHRLDEIDASMRRHGYTAPVMVDEGTERIVAGHGRLDTLNKRRLGGREPPDGVVVRDGKWLVPTVRGISFADPTEAMSYLLADNRIQEIGGYDWHKLGEIAREVSQSAEGLVGTGYVDLAEIEAKIDGAVKDFLDAARVLPDADLSGQEIDSGPGSEHEPKQKVETFRIMVQCEDATVQQSTLATLVEMGLNARCVL